MRSIVLIAHDMRSTHNVGSLLRTAECMGVEKIYFTGYTPYPLSASDTRLPHLSAKLHKDITKTALGAETLVNWHYHDDITSVIKTLRDENYQIIALEQASSSVELPSFSPPEKLALLLGREVEGIDPELLARCDTHLEIPQFGKKESLNVIQAAAMALYHIRFAP